MHIGILETVRDKSIREVRPHASRQFRNLFGIGEIPWITFFSPLPTTCRGFWAPDVLNMKHAPRLNTAVFGRLRDLDLWASGPGTYRPVCQLRYCGPKYFWNISFHWITKYSASASEQFLFKKKKIFKIVTTFWCRCNRSMHYTSFSLFSVVKKNIDVVKNHSRANFAKQMQ